MNRKRACFGRRVTPLTLAALLVLAGRTLWAADPPLAYVANLKSDDLKGIVSVDISRDGRHLYAAAYQAKSIGVFARDAQTGLLERIETVSEPAVFDGITAARLSPDNRFLVTAAFRSNAVALYSRDPKTGKLTKAGTVVRTGKGGALLNFAVDAAWSPDSAHVYVIAANSAAVNVFRITGQPSLELVEVEEGNDRSLRGARGIAVSPDGNFVYIAGEQSNALSVFKRDARTGKLDWHQVLKSGQHKAAGLNGAFSVAASPDGAFVYLSSGRFHGTDAITVFKKQNDGTLQFVEELINYTDKLERFVGGNEITLSPDGKRAYAVGSRSDSLVVFDRNPATGTLKQTQFLVDNFKGVGPMVMPGGVEVSPDGRFVYVASEGSSALTIFQRTGPAIAEKTGDTENGR